MIEENQLNEARILNSLRHEFRCTGIDDITINIYEDIVARLNNMIRVKNDQGDQK